jgi:endothelin-converting enzyme/putative endopeptidase
MAKAALDRVSRREPSKVYTRWCSAKVRELTPVFDWAVYLRDLQAPSFYDMNVAEPEFMKGVNELLTKARCAICARTCAGTCWTRAPSSCQSPSSTRTSRSRNSDRQKQLRPRWKRCVQYTDSDLGEVVGKVFVQRAFGADAKARTLDMVNAIEHAMESDLQTLTWMSDENEEAGVREAARGGQQDRVSPTNGATTPRCGSCAATRSGNSQRANAFELARQLAKIGRPVDKTEWG